MSTNYNPIKTEYAGCVFDSKSEAVFARVLHILGHQYEYHVDYLGHEWDFLVFRKPNEKSRPYYFFEKLHIASPFAVETLDPPILVEYKPSPPTKTYIENLTSKMSERPKESVLVWGNPWSGVQKCFDCENLSYVCYPIFTTSCRYGWGDFCQEADNGGDLPYSNRHTFQDMFGCKYEYQIQEALKHRFDLR